MSEEKKGQKPRKTFPNPPTGDMFGEWPGGKPPPNVTVHGDGQYIEYGPISEEEIQRRIAKNIELYPGPDRKTKAEQRAEIISAARAVERVDEELKKIQDEHSSAKDKEVALEAKIRAMTFKNLTDQIVYRFDVGQNIAYIAQAIGKSYTYVHNTLHRKNRI